MLIPIYGLLLGYRIHVFAIGAMTSFDAQAWDEQDNPEQKFDRLLHLVTLL